MITEHILDDKYKIVRFYIEHLPFEIYTEIENDANAVASRRRLELDRDYEQYGDYLHSDLFVDKTKPEIEEE